MAVESQMSAADSPASAPRKDFVPQRFGADPPRDLVELRSRVCVDIGAACGIPRSGYSTWLRAAKRQREGWRQFVSTSVDGLARRLEAQILTQLGVEVAIDTAPLGGRDLAARASATFVTAGINKGEGLTVADARQAAGI